jgi:purine-nucleoside phosphorylase
VRALDREVKESVSAIAKRLAGRPRVAVILGSGLGGFADSLDGTRAMAYREVPHFPASTTPGHAGRLCLGRADGVEVLVLQGRVHLYEGHQMDRVAYAVHVLAALGVKALVVTNASGSANPHFAPGDLVVLHDQVNLMWTGPFAAGSPAHIGPPRDVFPDALVDMADPYDPEFTEIALRIGLGLGLPVRRGIACAVSGPSYETPAEIRMMRSIGADTVSMSTIPEVLVARSYGIRVLGIACVTNLAAGVGAEPLRHEDVLETTKRSAGDFARLLRAVLPEIAKA